MPVPDTVVFGPAIGVGSITYVEVRQLSEEEKFRALQRRFDRFFIEQVDDMAKKVHGQQVVYSPFPLFLMTCVGIETIGKVFFSRAPRNGEQEEDVQREGFLKICKDICVKLSRPLGKKQSESYDQLWGQNEHDKVTSYAHIVYRLGRHTMIHGYRGKGVYLTEDVTEWSFEDGAVILNPYWFWNRYKQAAAKLWQEFHANHEPTNPLKKSARLYLSEVLE